MYSDESPISQTITYQGSLLSYDYENVEIGNLLRFLSRVHKPQLVYLVDNLNWDTELPTPDYDTYIIGCFGENANLKWLTTVNKLLAEKKLILITSLYLNNKLHGQIDNFRVFYLEHLHTIKKFYPKVELPEVKKREYDHSVLNRRFESIRLLFTACLVDICKSNLIYSFHKTNIAPEFLIFENIISDLKGRYEFIPDNKILDSCKRLWESPSKIVDNSQWSINNDAYLKTKLHWVNESYYGAIGTEIFSAYLTEKTIKPIVSKTPFVILGQTDSYKKLINLGFHPYHDILDIDFDAGKDEIRILKAINLMKKLSDVGIDVYIDKLLEVAEFNYNYFYESLENFCNKLNEETIEHIINYYNG